jgi:hypothetical protein
VRFSANLEREWDRLAAAGSSDPDAEFEPPPLTHQDLYALKGAAHVMIRDARIANPGTGFAAMR